MCTLTTATLWPGSNYPVMLDDCRAGPPPSAASAAEASLPDPRPVRASFLSGVSPLPGSRSRLSMYAAPDMGPFSGACAAGFFSLAEKSSLEKNLGPFCCHKNTSFSLTWYFYLHLATFFSIYNKRLLRLKTGGACWYMPQDGHWIASFEFIPLPKKVSFSAAKKMKIPHCECHWH